MLYREKGTPNFYFCPQEKARGVQNLGKHAYIILERSPISLRVMEGEGREAQLYLSIDSKFSIDGS